MKDGLRARPRARYDLSALKLVTVSGEPPAISDIERLLAGICRNIASLYLSSEGCTGSAVLVWTEDMLTRGKAENSGRPGVGVDVKILDPDGGFEDEMPPGELGEVAVSGPSLAVGYWRAPELTQLRLQGGWWRSGVIGRIDQDGDLWVVGRIDNIINTGGIKVSGEEIEPGAASSPQRHSVRRRRQT